MKNIGKKIVRTGVLLMLIFSVAFTTENVSTTMVQAASTRTKAMKAYKKFLKRGSFTTNYGRTYRIKGFTTIDINKDKVPELIIESVDESGISVFTYKKGIIRMLSDWIGQVWAWDKGGEYIEYNPSQKALVVRSHGGTGLSGYDLIQYKKGKMYTKLRINMSNYWLDGKVTRSCSYSKYNGNGKECSYKTYKKFNKQYFTGKKIRKYHFKKNTTANRNKLR